MTEIKIIKSIIPDKLYVIHISQLYLRDMILIVKVSKYHSMSESSCFRCDIFSLRKDRPKNFICKPLRDVSIEEYQSLYVLYNLCNKFNMNRYLVIDDIREPESLFMNLYIRKNYEL